MLLPLTPACPVLSLNGMFDVAVVGAGVVGCAVARRFALGGAKTVLLEKGADILSGASKGNSAILHTGFDAPPDSLELACMRSGYREYLTIRDSLGLPLLESGAMVLAWDDEQVARLPGIVEAAHGNGVEDVRAVERVEILAREPHLSPAVKAGVLVPREFLIDPWSAPLAYVLQAIAAGARVRRNIEVLGGEFSGGRWELRTSEGAIEATTIVNCAGLFGDALEKALLGGASFTIKPRKGQFVVYDKQAVKLLRHIILPVPGEHTKGIVVTPTIFGNVLVGPTAEEQESRTDAGTDHGTLEMLKARGEEILPDLAQMGVNAIYAGIRPATERKHYRARHEPERNYIGLNGIRSTGLTAALGLALHAWELHGGGAEEQAAPAISGVPRLAECALRDWQTEAHGEIVCHCEMVTRQEIEAALQGPLPAGDFGGLRRRTRAGMGRCQGFYCHASLAVLSAGKLQEPLAHD
ncbi:NAD(P)/FAD-dependent oxidoreductase [Acidocella sp.]|uniref:NAD(P)/FAD-dependent oxidoreductase n=1 Tax=Acidocella sp. TaxID=50710 RepID=UPI003CFEA860